MESSVPAAFAAGTLRCAGRTLHKANGNNLGNASIDRICAKAYSVIRGRIHFLRLRRISRPEAGNLSGYCDPERICCVGRIANCLGILDLLLDAEDEP